MLKRSAVHNRRTLSVSALALMIAIVGSNSGLKAQSPIVDENFVLNLDSAVMKRIVELTRESKDYSKWFAEGLVDICLYEDATTYFVEFNAKYTQRKASDPPPKEFLILEIFNSLLVDKKTLETKDWVFKDEMEEMPKVFIGATGSLPHCSIFSPLYGNYRIVPVGEKPLAGSQTAVPKETPKEQR